MEDTLQARKRAAASADHEDSAPPPKRQATMTNGAGSEDKADTPKFGTVNCPWQTDLETQQKDAIWRQMREYKREKGLLENQVAELEKKTAHHNDHLAIIDNWFDQLIDEVSVLVGTFPPPSAIKPESNDEAAPPSALLFKDNEKFFSHLGTRADKIKATISALYSRLPITSSDTRELQLRLNELLAKEKAHIVELQAVMTEKAELEDLRDTAVNRYLMAERKLDRSKSNAVASLEMQSQMQSQAERSDSDTKMNGDSNGVPAENGVASEEAERDRLEAIAVTTKVKEQLAQLEHDNSKMTREVTTLKSRLDGLTDDDYANTELFKLVKSQLEDSYNKLNDLEATHIQLREEAKKAQAERTSYRLKIDEESRIAISEAEAQLARAEADLQRIRANRDDLQAKTNIQEASQVERLASVEQTNALTKAGEHRIAALELQVERLKVHHGEIIAAVSEEELKLTDIEEIRAKLVAVNKDYTLLLPELQSIEQAWKSAKAQAQSKIAQTVQYEEQIGRLSAEKAKAAEKYFGAMKTKESQDAELKSLRRQNKASSGIIASLKETEAKIRELSTNLEKQLAEDKGIITNMSREQQILEQKAAQAGIAESGLQNQVVKLRESLSEKDSMILAAEHARREAEQKAEALEVQIEAAKKKTQEWRTKAQSSSSDEVINLRRVAYCHCGKNLKDTCITLCGHILCKTCIDERIKVRARKCPMCMTAFGLKDTKQVHLV